MQPCTLKRGRASRHSHLVNAAHPGGRPVGVVLSKAREILVCGAAVGLLDREGKIRTRILLLPVGKLQIRDGRGPFFLKDKAHADRVIAASRAFAGAQDILIDYDHQSIFAAKDGVGGVAPASGWVKPETLAFETLTVDEGTFTGIWGDVKWTGKAEAELKDHAYRYFSPTFKAETGTGLIAFIFNGTLTNTPAIDGLPAIAASLSPPEGVHMDLTALAAMLGLPATATLEQVTAALTAMTEANAAAVTSTKAIAAALGLAETVDGDELVTAATQLVATGGRPDPKKYVPIEGLTALQAQVKGLTDEQAERVVGEAVAAGKIAPALKAWAADLYRSDLQAFTAYVDKATPVITPGLKPGGKPPGEGVVALSAEQEALCEQLGISAADYLETLKKEQR